MRRIGFRGMVVWLGLAAAAAGAADGPAAPAGDLFSRLRKHPVNPVFLDELKAALPALTDPGTNAMALAVYSLGSLFNDDPREAQRARDALAARHPDSPYLRYLTMDELSQPCPACAGAGDRGRAVCERCRGTRKCNACAGKGKLRLMGKRQEVECSGCNGTGRCRACNGTGRIETAGCKRCGGKKTVLDKWKIRRVAYGLLYPPGAALPAEADEKIDTQR